MYDLYVQYVQGIKRYPVYDQNGLKTLPFGAADTEMGDQAT